MRRQSNCGYSAARSLINLTENDLDLSCYLESAVFHSQPVFAGAPMDVFVSKERISILKVDPKSSKLAKDRTEEPGQRGKLGRS